MSYYSGFKVDTKFYSSLVEMSENKFFTNNGFLKKRAEKKNQKPSRKKIRVVEKKL